MKKMMIALFGSVLIAATSFAQTMPLAEKAKAAKVEVVKSAEKVKADAIATKADTKKAADKASDKASTTVVKLKKDATPDMRFKENKLKAKADTTVKKLKKDGTPDMRFKQNKKKA